MDVDSAITKSFEKLGFISIKEEQHMAIKAFGEMLVFDILNGHHEHEPGTFKNILYIFSRF